MTPACDLCIRLIHTSFPYRHKFLNFFKVRPWFKWEVKQYCISLFIDENNPFLNYDIELILNTNSDREWSREWLSKQWWDDVNGLDVEGARARCGMGKPCQTCCRQHVEWIQDLRISYLHMDCYCNMWTLCLIAILAAMSNSTKIKTSSRWQEYICKRR